MLGIDFAYANVPADQYYKIVSLGVLCGIGGRAIDALNNVNKIEMNTVDNTAVFAYDKPPNKDSSSALHACYGLWLNYPQLITSFIKLAVARPLICLHAGVLTTLNLTHAQL